MANVFKFEKDDASYNEIFKASEGFTQKSKNRNNTNYTTRNVLKDFDSIYNKKYEDVLNADKARQKAEEERKKREEEARIKKEKEDYYNKNKDKMINDRTNSLIYSWNLEDSGGTKYNYDGAIDTSKASNYSNLGINDLSLDNFLVVNEIEKYKKAANEWNNIFNNNSNSNQTEANKIFNDITDKNIKANYTKINQYENKNSYYKKYIQDFNNAIKSNDMVAANNAIEKINSKYFGADYDDGMISSLFNQITGYKDAKTLEDRFNTNVEKLNSINNSIKNGVGNETLAKLESEKAKLEFENQLIQYNRLTSIYSNQEKLKIVDSLAYDYDKSFTENLTGSNKSLLPQLKWSKDRNAFENIVNNGAEILNSFIQIASATSSKIQDESFGSIQTLLTNDMKEGGGKDFANGVIDFASYLVPGIGKAKLILDTTSMSGVFAPGVHNTLLDLVDKSVLDINIDKQESLMLGGDNPNYRQTVGSAVYIATNFILDKLINATPLSKFSFDDKTRLEISKMTGKNIMKAMGLTGVGEAFEEGIQAFAEEAVYGDQNKTIFTKETLAKSFKNAMYAFIVATGVSGTQVATSKLAYKNSITTDTVYTDTESIRESSDTQGTNSTNISGSKKVEKVDKEDLYTKIDETLTKGDIINVINNNVIADTTSNINLIETTTPITTKNTISNIKFDTDEIKALESLTLNTKFYEDNNIPVNATVNDIYTALINNNIDNSLTDKLFYYNKKYSETAFSNFVDEVTNNTIDYKTLEKDIIPKNVTEYINKQDLTENTTTTIVPSAEAKTYVESKNPNANVVVIDPKSPTYYSDIKSYVEGKSTYNLGFKDTVKVESIENKVSSTDIKNISNMINSFRDSLITDIKEDVKIPEFKINTSDISTGNPAIIMNSIYDSFLNDIDSGLYSKATLQSKYKELSAMLNKYFKSSTVRTNIKDSNGNVVVFNKTGLNTYSSSNNLSGDIIPALVKSTGKVIYGDSDAKLKLTENGVNRVNKMIDKLDMNGDYLTTSSTGKDVKNLIDKNKNLASEILQALGYDGIISGKKKINYTSAVDNVDNVNLDTVAKNTNKRVDDIMNLEKSSDKRTEFIARMQIARDMINNSKTTKPEKIGTKSLDSKNINIKTDLDTNTEVNRVNKTITKEKVDANQDRSKLLTPSDKEYILKNKQIVRSTNTLGKWLKSESFDRDRFPIQVLNNNKRPSAYGQQYIYFRPEIYNLVDTNKIFDGDGATNRKGIISESNRKFSTISEQIHNNPRLVYDEINLVTDTSFNDVTSLIDKVIIPKNSSRELINLLNKNNIPIEYYEPRPSNNATKEIEPINRNEQITVPIETTSKIKVGDIEVEGSTEMYSSDVLGELNKIQISDKKANKIMKDAVSKIYTAIVDRYHPILKIADASSDIRVKNAISDLYTLNNVVNNNINASQTDINNNPIGKSINQIKKQVKKEHNESFNLYMRLLLNAERIENNMDKLLNLDPKTSRKAALEIEKEHPYFKAVASDIKQYNINSNAKLREAGIITKAQEKAANAKYQYYFPVYTSESSDFVDIGKKSYYKRLKVNDTMQETSRKRNKVLDIWTALGAKEYNIDKAILLNNTAKTIASSTDGDYSGYGGQLIYFDNGEAKSFSTSTDIAAIFNKTDFEKMMNDVFSLPGLNLLPNIKEIQRKMITTYDPIYQLTNIQRDFADSALFYSKYKTKFIQNYARAIYNVATNSVYYNEILKSGIIPMPNSTNKFKRIADSFESLPKIAEYMSAKQSGKTDIEAKIDAQDVNLNFARGGYVSQSLNKHGWLFLNASIQGFDKTMSTAKRLVTGAKTPKGAIELVLTVGAMVTPGILNSLMNEDDEDYNKLPYYYKNNYYFIKTGDNTFLRLPKGRIVGFTDTLVRYATGITKENTISEYIEAIKSGLDTSILPSELSEASPLAEISNIKNNKTYFGTEIYNENSPAINKALDIGEYLLQNIFGKYGKAVKNALDGDPTTDVWTVNGYTFDSTKYDKNLSTLYDLQERYQYLKKQGNMSMEDKITKKYIDSKIAAIKDFSADINKGKKEGLTVQDMTNTYQMRDAITKDAIDNYKSYEITKFDDYWVIVFDDAVFTYDIKEDSLTKVKEK